MARSPFGRGHSRGRPRPGGGTLIAGLLISVSPSALTVGGAFSISVTVPPGGSVSAIAATAGGTDVVLTGTGATRTGTAPAEAGAMVITATGLDDKGQAISATKTVMVQASDVTAPAQITDWTFTTGLAANQVVASIGTAPSDGGSAITGYEYSLDGGTTVVTLSGSSPWTLTMTAAGTSYTAVIRARNAVGAGDWSASKTATSGASTYVGFGGAYPVHYLDNKNDVAQDINTVAYMTALTTLTNPQFLCNNTLSASADSIAEMTVEYPSGTFTNVLFSGATSVTIPAGAGKGKDSYVLSDAISLTIPAGATYKVRTLKRSDGTTKPTYVQCAAAHGGYAFSTAGTATNQTHNSSFVGTTGYSYFPTAIANIPTSVPSVLLTGDSIVWGQGDTMDSLGRVGIVLKSIPATIAAAKVGIQGTNFSSWANYTFFQYLAQYATTVVCNYGTNQIAATGTTAASWLTSAQAFWSRSEFDGKKKIQCTITPHSTSTDAWITEANQTAYRTSPYVGNGDINAYITGLTCGADDYFDTAAGLSGTDINKWWTDGTAITTDGLHPNAAGYNRVVAQGVITTSKLV